MSHPLPTEVLTTCTDGMLFCFSQWASRVTTGAFWVFALIGFAFALFMATIRFGTPKAFGFGSFVLMIGGVWLSVLTLIPWWIGSAFILIGTIGIAIVWLSER